MHLGEFAGSVGVVNCKYIKPTSIAEMIISSTEDNRSIQCAPPRIPLVSLVAFKTLQQENDTASGPAAKTQERELLHSASSPRFHPHCNSVWCTAEQHWDRLPKVPRGAILQHQHTALRTVHQVSWPPRGTDAVRLRGARLLRHTGAVWQAVLPWLRVWSLWRVCFGLQKVWSDWEVQGGTPRVWLPTWPVW